MDKTSEAKWKKIMTLYVNNQMLAPSPTHNFKHAQCELKGK